VSPVSGRRLWGTAGGLMYRGVTGQSPVTKKDFKDFEFKDFKDFEFNYRRVNSLKTALKLK
jgi:hypothetical protein